MDMKSRAYITSFIFLFFFLVIQFARWKVSPSFHTRTTSRKRRKGIERRQRDRNSVQHQQTSSRTMGISLMIQLTAAFLVGFVITIYMIITHPGKWNTFTVLWLAGPFFGSAGATDWNRNDKCRFRQIRASTTNTINDDTEGLSSW